MYPTHDGAPDAGEDFLRLLAQHERWLATYVFSLFPSAADAEDVLQECKVLMWKRFDQFKPGTNFRAWARTLAFHLVLNHHRATKRRPIDAYSQEFIEAIALEIDQRSEKLEQQADALRHCVQKLPATHRAMIRWRYYDERDIPEIANETRRSAEAVYRLLSRIRQTLSECVQRQLLQSRSS
jgi:RNA polymerase sigma-70 factor (ECF subfamily)